jgi:hypothetical protein
MFRLLPKADDGFLPWLPVVMMWTFMASTRCGRLFPIYSDINTSSTDFFLEQRLPILFVVPKSPR